ncbi:MAG: peptidase [Bacteroidota bacterium]|nr:peptidase [Bacteroidota bacterium]
MRTFTRWFVVFTAAALIAGCGAEKEKEGEDMSEMPTLDVVKQRRAMYADTDIAVDLSHLSERQRALIAKLIEAGRLVDQVFWQQSSRDAVALRDSLAAAGDSSAQAYLEYVNINYGPYDRIFEGERFVGHGPARKPAGAGYYPEDMTREEFESFIAAHPDQKEALESQYTVVVRNGDRLEAVPFYHYYTQTGDIVTKLQEAAALADNASLKKYLELRAIALATDDYYESDMAWMDLEGNDIDVVIGPIENYEDGLFNYKTAHECAVMVKDPEGTAELQMFIEHIDAFEQALPIKEEYKRASAGSGNVLEVVNIVYFGGDFQAGVKTIAASLPNDPRVTQEKGGKKQMYRNMMEAKFDKIVVPIAERILDPALREFVDRKAFTSFVTLHEVSHTLGRAYVYGNDDLSVRRAMKERYSAIEECKADVLGLYNNQLLHREGIINDVQRIRSIVTYVAGLFRSLRFGAEEAHGQANLVQLNWLLEHGAITEYENDTFAVDFGLFMDVAEKLATKVLTIEIEGDYDGAGTLLQKYGKMTPKIEATIEMLKDIPRDLNTRYVTEVN